MYKTTTHLNGFSLREQNDGSLDTSWQRFRGGTAEPVGV